MMRRGYYPVKSNEDKNTPFTGHWTRLPMILWCKKDVYDTPIQELMLVHKVSGNKQEHALMQEGFMPIVQDLGVFGLDHCLQLWYLKMQEFDDEIDEFRGKMEDTKKEWRKLHKIPLDVDPAERANEAGGGKWSDKLRSIVDYFGITDKEVLHFYKNFCKLAQKGFKYGGNFDAKVTPNELFYKLGFEHGAIELGEILAEVYKVVGMEYIGPDDFMDFQQYMQLVCVWCLFDHHETLQMFFNICDVKGRNGADFNFVKDRILQMHLQAKDYRLIQIQKTLKHSFTEEKFAPDLSGKLSYKSMVRMHSQLPLVAVPNLLLSVQAVPVLVQFRILGEEEKVHDSEAKAGC